VYPAVQLEQLNGSAAGFKIRAELVPAVAADAARGAELAEVLRLAAQFPARHAVTLEAPVFGRHGGPCDG
jgi:hypothetical protein